jgi:hypothetical protein
VSNCVLCIFQLTKALRDLPLRIQTASKKERNVLLQNVVAVLSNPGNTRQHSGSNTVFNIVVVDCLGVAID